MRIRAEFLDESERADWLGDLDELELIADSAIRLVREEAGGGDEQPLALDLLVRETAIELSEQNFDIVVTSVEPAMVHAGQWALKRALRNIFINAATHGGGGRIALSASDGLVTILVENDGPGIPGDLIDKVFEPFFRAEPGRVQTVPGAGLGLAIAHEIIDRFGGSVKITNGPTRGLIQTISFPLVARA
jgi:signal transduction histidine kinase